MQEANVRGYSYAMYCTNNALKQYTSKQKELQGIHNILLLYCHMDWFCIQIGAKLH